MKWFGGIRRTLKLAPPANLGLRQEEILKGDPSDEESPSLIAYREWKTQRETTSNARRQEKQFDIFTATEAAEAPRSSRQGAVRSSGQEPPADPPDRDSEPWFIPFCATRRLTATNSLRNSPKVHGRVFGATDQEIEHAAEAVPRP